ncbi:MAG: 5'-methylthioadenosine/S-adenosylhomocysteine nucleosidase [Bacilli bacterium]|nr:5'-methylthioadenosine/S-adenosylhomocysteine nucleosidase [Bacilli bacterium]
MQRFGLVVAVEEEAVKELYGRPLWQEECAGIPFSMYSRHDKEIIMACTGIGTIASSAATAILIEKYQVEAILNFGVVGAMTNRFSTQAVAFIKEVVDYEYDVSEIDALPKGMHEGYLGVALPLDEPLLHKARERFPDIPVARLASGNSFLVGERKIAVNREFGAELCDMELAGIYFTASRAKIPTFSIKAVSDGIEGDGEEFYLNKKKASLLCLKVLDSILE